MPVKGQDALFLKIDSVWIIAMCVCVYIFALGHKLLVVWCDMIKTPYDWLNKLYSVYMAVIVSIISRPDLRIEANGIILHL